MVDSSRERSYDCGECGDADNTSDGCTVSYDKICLWESLLAVGQWTLPLLRLVCPGEKNPTCRWIFGLQME